MFFPIAGKLQDMLAENFIFMSILLVMSVN